MWVSLTKLLVVCTSELVCIDLIVSFVLLTITNSAVKILSRLQQQQHLKILIILQQEHLKCLESLNLAYLASMALMC